MKNQRIVLAARPVGEPKLSDFRNEASDIPLVQDGQVLLRTDYLSLDPYMRGRMSEAKSYAEPVAIGAVMPGSTVAEVVESKNAEFRVGDKVLSYSGWQAYSVSGGKGLRKLAANGVRLTTALGILGMPGLTAYSGLLNIGQPKAGETVCVAAATGPVGSLVGQIAKIKGCKTVGIAGGEKKCRALIEEFGFDVAVDHHSIHFPELLAKACPEGIDIYFENVGGQVWKVVQNLLNDFARVPICGLIAHYNATHLPMGPDHCPELMLKILSKRWTLRGFIVSDFNDQYAAFQRDVTSWLTAGKIKYREDIVDGLDSAPEAFIGLLSGRNFGKLIVRVAAEN